MTKAEFTELTQRFLSGGDCPSDVCGRYHSLVIEKYIEMAYGDILMQLPSSQLDAYVKAYNNITVSFDSARDEYYSELPSTIISLPMGRGIRLISPQQEQKLKFIYTANNSDSVYDELEVRTVLNKRTFYIENTKVYYRNINGVDKVLMKLVVPFSAFDDDDNIAIPSTKHLQIFAAIVQLLRQQPFQKQSNNNNPQA